MRECEDMSVIHADHRGDTGGHTIHDSVHVLLSRLTRVPQVNAEPTLRFLALIGWIQTRNLESPSCQQPDTESLRETIFGGGASNLPMRVIEARREISRRGGDAGGARRRRS